MQELVGDVLEVLQDHHELVAPQARGRVALADAQPEARGDLHQQLVSGLVAVGIVELLEVVEVDQQQRALVPATRTAAQGPLQAVEHQTPVGQPGQRIEEGELVDLVLLALALGDVLVETEDAHHLAAHADRRDQALEDARLAVDLVLDLAMDGLAGVGTAVGLQPLGPCRGFLRALFRTLAEQVAPVRHRHRVLQGAAPVEVARPVFHRGVVHHGAQQRLLLLQRALHALAGGHLARKHVEALRPARRAGHRRHRELEPARALGRLHLEHLARGAPLRRRLAQGLETDLGLFRRQHLAHGAPQEHFGRRGEQILVGSAVAVAAAFDVELEQGIGQGLEDRGIVVLEADQLPLLLLARLDVDGKADHADRAAAGVDDRLLDVHAAARHGRVGKAQIFLDDHRPGGRDDLQVVAAQDLGLIRRKKILVAAADDIVTRAFQQRAREIVGVDIAPVRILHVDRDAQRVDGRPQASVVVVHVQPCCP